MLRVPQLSVKYSACQKRLDMADALVPRPFEVLQRQPRQPVGLVNLLSAHARVPPRLECRQLAANFIKTHTVRPFVRAGIVGKLDRARRYDISDDLGQVPNTVVVGGLTDVECLIEYRILRRLNGGDECTGDILDMHDRPPWRAIRFQMDLSCGECPGDKIIEDNIKAHPRRYAI